MRQTTSVNLTSIYGRIPLSQQERLEMHKMAIDSDSNSRRPPPNLPRLDLLTGSGVDYVEIGIPLYEASITGDWKRAKAIFDKNPELVRYSLTENGETALHIAVSTEIAKQAKEFVENLVHLMNEEDLTLQNKNYNTALYLASAADNIKVVEIMVKKNNTLLTIPGGGGQIMPLYAAVLFGSYGVVQYLYENSHKSQDDCWTEINRGLLLEKCVERCLFDVAIQIVKDHPELASNGNVLRILAGKTDEFWVPEINIKQRTLKYYVVKIRIKRQALQLLEIILENIAKKPKYEIDEILKYYGVRSIKERKALELLKIILENIAKKPKYEIDEILKGPKDAQVTKPDSGTVDQSLELQKVFSEHFVNLQVETQNIMEQDAKLGSVYKKDQAKKLEKIISEHIAKMQVKTQEIIRGPAANETHSSQVLFIAAESGNTIFIVELLRRYPDLIWSINDNNQSIFHIAVKHRHKDIYNLLHEIGIMKHIITSLIDDRGNNMSHLAAKRMKQMRRTKVPEGIIRMRMDILWFKEIERIHPFDREQTNEDGLTPHELFLKEHEEMAVENERRVKEIAGQCMVVATLIAAMVFTAAYTVPGGYDQATGFPIFYSKSTFTIFFVADAISIFFSTTSLFYFILLFINSSHSTIDYYDTIFHQLRMGLGLLLLSLTSMTIAFCASLFLLYHKGILWIPILITILASIALYHYGPLVLYFFFIVSHRHLFNRKKQLFLYHQNPQV